jgi:Mrp family chromosome partitioning ATPase
MAAEKKIINPSIVPEDISAKNESQPQEIPREDTKAKVHSLVRLKKTVVVNDETGDYVDEHIISSQYYNNFNYSLLPRENGEGKLVLGVTSASPGDGKTLVASNLAASFAMAQQKETVLVDLNIGRPRLHNVFGTPLSPGLLDAFFETTVRVTETKLKHLSVLSAGDLSSSPLSGMLYRSNVGNKENVDFSNFSLRLEQLPEFRNVIYSLLELYDFVIVDLPSISDVMVPPLFMNHLDGIIIVVTTGVTKQEDIDRVISQLDEQKILGFVLNRAQ